MAEDVVARLQHWATYPHRDAPAGPALLLSAASEIERLRAEKAQREQYLKDIVSTTTSEIASLRASLSRAEEWLSDAITGLEEVAECTTWRDIANVQSAARSWLSRICIAGEVADDA